MAETSGFATDLPQSARLATTVRRAISAAQQRSHRYVTLEHLLLALVDDPDAQELLAGLRVNAGAVKAAVADTVNRNLATLCTPGEFDLRASYKVERVLQTASDDARRLNCAELDGSFVLAALAREGDSPAADIVKHHGLGFSNAVTWLYGNRGNSYRAAPAPRETAPPQQPETPPQPQPQLQRHGQFPAREVVRSEASAPPQPAPQSRIASPQALAEEEAIELELEVLDERPEPEIPAAQSNAAPRPVLARAVSAPLDGQAHEPRAPVTMPPAAPQMRAPMPLPAQTAPQPIPMPRPDMRASAPDTATPVAPQRQRAQAPMREQRTAEVSPPPQQAPAPAPAAAPAPVNRDAPPRRPEANIPLARLEEMRVRAPGSAAASAPASPPAKASRKKSDAQKRGGSRRQRGVDAQVGKLVENIPRRMRAGVTERIEVRITREETETFTRGMVGRGEIVRHELLVTSAMSVMLRAPDGGFVIETLSPETQWILEGVERPEDQNYGRWRWAVTPSERGQRKLQLVIGARTVDISGMVGETALPDQIINVSVRTNYFRGLKRLMEWVMVAAAGGVITELAVKVFNGVIKI